jgi:hypothetical protein
MQVFIVLQVKSNLRKPKQGILPALSAQTTHSTIQRFWSNVHIQNSHFFLLLPTFHVQALQTASQAALILSGARR